MNVTRSNSYSVFVMNAFDLVNLFGCNSHPTAASVLVQPELDNVLIGL